MKKIIGLALLASAAAVGAANAEGSFSGNVALTTDYVFRGISQTQDGPAIQGGFDYANGQFYAGVWASNLDFGSTGGFSVDAPLEIDLYGGWKPQVGPFTLDLGVIGYFYPGADDDNLLATGDFDYGELKFGASVSPVENLTVAATAYWSPEFPADGGNSWYLDTSASYTFNDVFSGSIGVSNQSADTTGYFVTTTGAEDSYTAWNVGGTASVYGFGVDLRYYDTSEDILNFAGNVVSDDRVVLTLKRAL